MDRRRNTNSCTSCLRIFTFVANLLFIVVGSCVAAVFIYMQVTQVDFVGAVLGTELVVAANCLLIAGGCLLLVTALLVGIAACATRTLSCITAELILLLVVFLTLVAGIVCALVFKTWLTYEVSHAMSTRLILKYGVDDKFTDNWDRAQYLWKCCSIDDHSWSTYVKTEWYKQQPGTPGNSADSKPFVPRSCCVVDESGNITDANLALCQKSTDGPPARPPGAQYTGPHNPALNYRGCLKSAQHYLIHENLSWFTVVIILGSISAGLVLIGTFMSLLFCVCRRKEVKSEKTLMVIDDANAHMLETIDRPPPY